MHRPNWQSRVSTSAYSRLPWHFLRGWFHLSGNSVDRNEGKHHGWLHATWTNLHRRLHTSLPIYSNATCSGSRQACKVSLMVSVGRNYRGKRTNGRPMATGQEKKANTTPAIGKHNRTHIGWQEDEFTQSLAYLLICSSSRNKEQT